MSAILPKRAEDNLIRDGQWLKRAMFIPLKDMPEAQVRNANYSDVMTYPYDTTPGGNPAMNPKPQFSPLADMRHPNGISSSLGMGRYYYEAIEQHEVRAYLQACVPQFNSLTSFLGHFYNPALGTLVNRGEAPSNFYKIGYAVGFLYSLPLQAFYGLSALVTRVGAFISNTPYSKFYYLKPNMRPYWNAVNLAVNKLAVNMGIVNGVTSQRQAKEGLDIDGLREFQELMPDILRFGGAGESRDLHGIDMYGLATRAQRLSNKRYRKLASIFKEGKTQGEYTKLVQDMINAKDSLEEQPSYSGTGSYRSYLSTFLQKGGTGEAIEEPSSNGTVTASSIDEDGSLKENKEEQSSFARYWERVGEEFMAELSDGAAFVVFNVDPPEPSESFSNSTKESSLVSMIDGANNAARDARFTFAEGNIVGGAKTVIEKFSDVVTGVLDSVGLNALAAAGGSAYVDIPKIYDKSDMDISSGNSFKLNLTTPYRDPMSIFLHQYIPLCMLLPLALPRSTGKHSYYMPFMVKLYIKGLSKVEVGMVTNFRIARAQGNTKITRDGLGSAIEVSFDIENMDQMAHMPISDTVSGETFGLFDETNVYQDYLTVLGGMGLADQFYMMPRVRLALASFKNAWNQKSASGNIASLLRNNVLGEIGSAIARVGDLRDI